MAATDFEEVQEWLKIPCEGEDLYAVRCIPHSVTSVGTCLGLDYVEIYGIDQNYREHYDKTLQLLYRWRSKVGAGRATWWNLIECLRKLEDRQLLEDMSAVVQQRIAANLCSPYRGMDSVPEYLTSHTTELYRQNDSGIIADLNTQHYITQPPAYGPSHPPPLSLSSLPRHPEPPNDFLSSPVDSSPPYHSSDFDYGSGDPGLTSLRVSDFVSLQSSALGPESSESSATHKTEFYTPPGSMADTDGGSHGAAQWEEPQGALAGETIATSQHYLQDLSERCRRQAEKVKELTKKLVHTQQIVFKKKQVNQALQTRLKDSDQKNDWLMEHVFKLCDHQYNHQYNQLCKENQELQLRLEEMRSQRTTADSTLQVQFIQLDREKKSMEEQLVQLHTKYRQAVLDCRELQLKVACESEQKKLQLMERLRSQQHAVRLETRLAELSVRNGELMADNARLRQQCAKLTSPISFYRLPGMYVQEGGERGRRRRRRSGESLTSPSSSLRAVQSDDEEYLRGERGGEGEGSTVPQLQQQRGSAASVGAVAHTASDDGELYEEFPQRLYSDTKHDN